jgi:UDP-glucose 4-epimerase
MNILITGGAGYIGSHVLKGLLETTSYDIIVIDNLSTGHQRAIDRLQTIRNFTFIQLDLKDFNSVDALFEQYAIEVVMHFAASSLVAQSIENPLKYYMNNTLNTTHLIECCIRYSVKKFIFSSTAAVYGQPDISTQSIDESSPTQPINPYGASKLMSEKILQDSAKESLKYVIFRYFNAAGADIYYHNEVLSPRIGEEHFPETHLIPLVVKTALNKREAITIFGSDYDTADGTCIRDYIHVDDIAQAHIQAIEYLDSHPSDIFNIGYAQGYSVKEVIETLKQVTQKDFKVEEASRRAGDPALLISNSDKIKSKMKWKPKYNNLALICKSAYIWESNLIEYTYEYQNDNSRQRE